MGNRALALAAPGPGWDVKEVEAILKRRIDQNASRGIAVALISKDGKVEVVIAGHSGNAARPAVDGDTLFEIGSITKVFTATMLAQVVEEGAVKPDAKVRDVLPGRAWRTPGAGDVTLLELATHTSGLPRIPGEWRFVSGMLVSFRNPYANYSADDLWTYVENLAHEPRGDHKFGYSNLGAGLLGQVLAEREGTTYESMVERRILKPLGMTWSGIRTAKPRDAWLAVGHSASLVPQPYWDIPALPGAGALRSSVNEMARFVRAHQQGTLAGALATHAARAPAGAKTAVGLGWIISRDHDDEILWHNGGTGGFRTFAGFSKRSGKGAVVLSNSAVDVDDIGLHLVNAGYKVNADPRTANWMGILVGLALAAAIVVRAWVSADPVPMPRPIGTKPTLRDRFLAWRRQTRIASKGALAWALLDLSAIAAVLYLLGPWEWVGLAGRNAFFALVALLALRMVWKLRRLPWRDPAPVASKAARYFAHSVTLIVLAVVAWNVW